MSLIVTERLWAALWVWAPLVLFVPLLAPEIATAAQRSKTIANIPPRPHYSPADVSPEQLVATITAAAGDKGWRIIGEAPGVLTALLVRRSHKAVVTIGYDESSFWIDYKDSNNLNYNPKDLMGMGRHRGRIVTKGPRIHPNYNLWVAALADRIAYKTRYPPKLSNAPPLPIADELDRLEGLRERGVLTQEEFDQQKAKLLAR
jgi:hypothetical protein